MIERPDNEGDEPAYEAERDNQARSRRNEFEYWHETGIAARQLRGCLMIPLGILIYFGGFIALIAWGNSILILLLWLFLIGPIVIAVVSFGVTIAMVPIAALLMLMAKVFHWGEDGQ